MRTAAIYARVSSEQQREAHTIASQTAALIEWARTLDLEVPKAWIIEDEGYSGATLERPGLERVRDLAAEGQIQAVLIYSPDRLSRKYAYQILLIEELARHGVETRFLNAPQNATAEDQLLVQFQGMIAEYERAQILERSRRGKRHRARAGEISVLSGAPYGYRYIRKSDEAPAAYVVSETEARVVRQVYESYTVAGWSIGAVTRWLNERGVATRKPGTRWERSMVWAMLRNPAYQGTACFGKTRAAPRQRVTRALRVRGGLTTRNSANHERPREEWIEIPVPALIDEPTFARAQELLHENKVRSRRRTIAPSLVQGLVSCRRCGYALSRTSTRSSARLIHYYRCIGSDAWRHLGGPRCDNRPVRQDLLDQIVWTEVIRLLEEPALIEHELDRRLAAARAADPTKQREQTVQRDLVRVGKSIERVLTAYQEGLLSLEQLRQRMPSLRQREQALRAELQSIADQTRERTTYLRLAETLSAFLARLRVAADTLDILERQRLVRLLIKEVLVGDDTIVIRHCIPVPSAPPDGSGPPPPIRPDDPGVDRSYLLRSGSDFAAALQHLPARARHRVDAAACTLGRVGALRGRRRGHVRHGGGVRAGRAARASGVRTAGLGAAPGEDEARRPLARHGGLRLPRLSPAQAHERTDLGTATPTGVLPPALALSARHATDSTARERPHASRRVSPGPARTHRAAQPGPARMGRVLSHGQRRG
jgi:site-specific DNA recombinase